MLSNFMKSRKKNVFFIFNKMAESFFSLNIGEISSYKNKCNGNKENNVQMMIRELFDVIHPFNSGYSLLLKDR